MVKMYQVYQMKGALVKAAVLLSLAGLLACGAEECKKSQEGNKRCDSDNITLQQCKDGTWDDWDCLEDEGCTGKAACVEDSKTEARCVCN